MKPYGKKSKLAFGITEDLGIGGVITAIGFVADLQMRVIAFISALIIAPGLELVVKMPFSIVLGKRDILWNGFKTLMAGYRILMLAAATTFFILLTAGSKVPQEF